MMYSTVCDYYAARIIAAPKASPRLRKGTLAVAIVNNLLLLAYFKYGVFAQENANALLQLLGQQGFRIMQITLPIGISFYTFQTISYTVDVYRGTAPPARRLSDFTCFVALVSPPDCGAHRPLQHHCGSIRPPPAQLRTLRLGRGHLHPGLRQEDPARQCHGAHRGRGVRRRFARCPDRVVGPLGLRRPDLFRFLRLFGHRGGPRPHGRFRNPAQFQFAVSVAQPDRVLAALAHVAVELSARLPLLSAGRQPPRRAPVDAEPVAGHAHWRPMARGLVEVRSVGRLPRLWLALERGFAKRDGLWSFLPRPLQMAVTFAIVLLSWVPFRADNWAATVAYLRALFGFGAALPHGQLIRGEVFSLHHVVMMGVCIFVVTRKTQAWDLARSVSWPKLAWLVPLFVLGLAAMYTQSFNPFLYFQF
jgi:alginate O-acetyltransferase complex protein AlgI